MPQAGSSTALPSLTQWVGYSSNRRCRTRHRAIAAEIARCRIRTRLPALSTEYAAKRHSACSGPRRDRFVRPPPCCGESRRWPASLMSEGERRTVPGQGQRFHARSVRQRGKDLPTLGRGLLWSSMVAVPVDWRRTSGIRPHPTDLPSQLVDIDAQPNQRQTGPGTARSAENPRQAR